MAWRTYTYIVTVEAHSAEQAEQVIISRMDCDSEDLGFNYLIDWEPELPDERTDLKKGSSGTG